MKTILMAMLLLGTVLHASPSVPTENVPVCPADTLTQRFQTFKGTLPLPMTGKCYPRRHTLTKGRGIHLKGTPGAFAVAVADGIVASVFTYNGMRNVLLRHGHYLTMYCNLDSCLVSQGDSVTAGGWLGTVHTDRDDGTLLYFEMRKERTPLDPFEWLYPGKLLRQDTKAVP